MSEGLKAHADQLALPSDIACRLLLGDPLLIAADAKLLPGRFASFSLGLMTVTFEVREQPLHDDAATQVLVLILPRKDKSADLSRLELRENALQELGKLVAQLEQQQKETDHG